MNCRTGREIACRTACRGKSGKPSSRKSLSRRGQALTKRDGLSLVGADDFAFADDVAFHGGQHLVFVEGRLEVEWRIERVELEMVMMHPVAFGRRGPRYPILSDGKEFTPWSTPFGVGGCGLRGMPSSSDFVSAGIL